MNSATALLSKLVSDVLGNDSEYVVGVNNFYTFCSVGLVKLPTV